MTLTKQQQQTIDQLHELIDTVDHIVIGKKETTRLTIAAMLAGGHVLFEDIPGVGKTLLVKTIARLLGIDFSRIQFTPDLIPSDIIGFSVPSAEEHHFVFKKGPLFSSLLLADEINRTSPRTQAALLEAMSEGHVTLDDKTHELPDPFFVLATQNPIDYEGTYPLPEAQLDRFLMQLSLGYPSPQQEVQMLLTEDPQETLTELRPLLQLADFAALKKWANAVYVHPDLAAYIVDLGQHTRKDAAIRLGISPRGNRACLAAAKAYALLEKRDYLIPDDILAVVPAVYRHRLLFYENLSAEQKDRFIHQLIQQSAVPVKRGLKK